MRSSWKNRILHKTTPHSVLSYCDLKTVSFPVSSQYVWLKKKTTQSDAKNKTFLLSSSAKKYSRTSFFMTSFIRYICWLFEQKEIKYFDDEGN